MTRSEAVAAAEELAAALEADLRLCSTRGEHVRVSQRLAEARALAERLREAPAPAA